MCPEQLMDIKRNKEYLVSHRENSPHGKVLRIKTSESVGTLHSISNCTDRSFAIKESSALQTSPIPQRNGVFFQQNYVEKLKEDSLHANSPSDEDDWPTSQFVNDSKSSTNKNSQRLPPTQTPSFNKFMKQNNDHSSQASRITVDNKQIISQSEQGQEKEKKSNETSCIRIDGLNEDDRFLYQQPEQQVKSIIPQRLLKLQDNLSQKKVLFEQNYQSIEKRIFILQQQNQVISYRCTLGEEKMQVSKGKIEQLQAEISRSRVFINQCMQESEELEQMLKQILLQNQLEKHKNKQNKREPRVRQTSKNSSLPTQQTHQNNKERLVTPIFDPAKEIKKRHNVGNLIDKLKVK